MEPTKEVTMIEDLEARLRYEKFLADLSARLTCLAPGDMDHEINDALNRICDLLGLDLSAAEHSRAAPEIWFHHVSNTQGLELIRQFRSDTGD